jgi:hypothetical protein
MMIFGRVASHLPMTTRCWLPPESVSTGTCGSSALMTRRSIHSSMSRVRRSPSIRRKRPMHL